MSNLTSLTQGNKISIPLLQKKYKLTWCFKLNHVDYYQKWNVWKYFTLGLVLMSLTNISFHKIHLVRFKIMFLSITFYTKAICVFKICKIFRHKKGQILGVACYTKAAFISIYFANLPPKVSLVWSESCKMHGCNVRSQKFSLIGLF